MKVVVDNVPDVLRGISFSNKNEKVSFIPYVPSDESKYKFPKKIENRSLKVVVILLLKSLSDVTFYSSGSSIVLYCFVPQQANKGTRVQKMVNGFRMSFVENT